MIDVETNQVPLLGRGAFGRVVDVPGQDKVLKIVDLDLAQPDLHLVLPFIYQEITLLKYVRPHITNMHTHTHTCFY